MHSGCLSLRENLAQARRCARQGDGALALSKQQTLEKGILGSDFGSSSFLLV